MRPFAALERFFERLFERPSARLFHARLQPIQLQRRIERAMETGRLSASDRILVPNRYVVRLNPADIDAFGELVPGLEAELAESALAFARAHRFTLTDRPQIHLAADRVIAAGDIRVDPSFVDPTAAHGQWDASRLAPGIGLAEEDWPVDWPDAGPLDLGGAPAALIGTPGSSHTMVFEVAHVDAPEAMLRQVGADGSSRQVAVDGGRLTIGRAADNGLVVRDSRVSRYHARLQARRGALVFTDLGSTNGSRVNGIRVGEVVLGEGDRIEIGNTTLIVESTPGG